MGIEAGAALRALRGLVDVQARALDDDLPGALQAVVDRLAEVLDVAGVAINLRRPAWDDFEIAAIHAPPAVVAELLGATVPRATVDVLLDPAFDVGGAFFVPAGSVDEAALEGPSAVIPRADRRDHPDGWQEDDELLVPIRATDGALLGFLSIDEPASGMRPGPEEVAVAVAVAEVAAAAISGAQRALEARRSSEALELLFELSAAITRSHDIDAVLHACCDGIHRALGFERVAIEVVEPGTDRLQVRASVGWDEGPPASSTLADVMALSDPAHEVEGCFLWPAEAALARVGEQARRHESRRNGRGPLAWDHHWLLVPLIDGDGRIGGWVWADDPVDHLLPTPAQLRVLRTFANQALAAVTGALNVGRLHELARVDDLTGVLNRRALFERLDEELARSATSAVPITLVLYDLDRFKAINDAHGHPTGDAALRGFTRLLERTVRAADAVGRVGGDEFALVLVGADEAAADHVVDRIARALEEDPPGLGAVRASHGVARSPVDGTTREALVAVADQRLYEHKRQHGRL